MRKSLVAASLTRSRRLKRGKQLPEQTGVISKFGKYIPNVGPAVSTIASSLGYGIPGYGESGGALNYSGGALNIRGGQCVPGPAFASKY